MAMEGITPIIAEGLTHFEGAGAGDGQAVRLRYAAPGFSLTYVWFKSGYPLPVHSHGSDCRYHIIGGSLRIGQETLGVGDGFFVASDVAYTYEPGPEGVEVLEFRNTDQLNIRFLSDKEDVWRQAVSVLKARRERWTHEEPPSRSNRDRAG